MKRQFLDIDEVRTFAVKAINHYQEEIAPGWFTDWLDDVYIRLGEKWQEVTLDELAMLQRLQEDGCWLTQAQAANMVYKLFHRLVRSTGGIAGYEGDGNEHETTLSRKLC